MFVNLSSIVRYGEECYNSVVFGTPTNCVGQDKLRPLHLAASVYKLHRQKVR